MLLHASTDLLQFGICCYIFLVVLSNIMAAIAHYLKVEIWQYILVKFCDDFISLKNVAFFFQ